MRVNYDQKYTNPNKPNSGVRQMVTSTRSTEDSSLKACIHGQNQSQIRLKVQMLLAAVTEMHQLLEPLIDKITH